MYRTIYLSLCLLIGMCGHFRLGGQTQHTVGVLSFDEDHAGDGYYLFYPFGQRDVFLVDACGEVVHTWEGEQGTVPGNAAWLLDDGHLVKGVRKLTSVNAPIWAGGGGETIEIRSWENDLVWSYTLNDSMRRLHHDFDVMPNGHILCIAWEVRSREEAIQAGRDPATILDGVLWPDMVLEIDPGSDSIVWEWHAWDHLIQEFDPGKENFGQVSEHPELIDLNLVFVAGVADWLHLNAIDYHPGLDLILLSSPHFGEAWVIDHSTTTEEAAGHSGGDWGRGGDLLFRWGNPGSYGRGQETDQRLFYPHDTRWVLDHIDPSDPLYGSISVFNNRVASDHSSANVFTPELDTVARQFRMEGGTYLPEDFSVSLFHSDTQSLFSPALSSVQILPDGNFLILAGRNGYGFEIHPASGAVVWEYVNPLVSGVPVAQGDPIANNLVFRMTFYPKEYPAFVGKDLTPQGFLELNPDTAFCDLTTVGVAGITRSNEIVVYPNPVMGGDDIHLEVPGNKTVRASLYDVFGRPINVVILNPGRQSLEITGVAPGIYFLVTDDPAHRVPMIVR